MSKQPIDEFINSIPQWPHYENIKDYDDLILNLFCDLNNRGRRTKAYTTFCLQKHGIEHFPNYDILCRYYNERFTCVKVRKWGNIIDYLLILRGYKEPPVFNLKSLLEIPDWPYYDNITEYDKLVLDLFYDYNHERFDHRTPLFRTFYSGHRTHKFPNEEILNIYYKERYPDSTIRNWKDIMDKLCVEYGLIEAPDKKHIDVLAIKPWPYYDDITQYDDLILDIFYEPKNEIGKITNAYRILNSYDNIKKQCQDANRWPEKFPNIDIIERYIRERYPGAKNLLECIYRLTVEKGLEKGYYCEHCGKLLWHFNWHSTSNKRFCSDACMREDEDYYHEWMNALIKKSQDKETRAKRSKTLSNTLHNKSEEERREQYGRSQYVKAGEIPAYGKPKKHSRFYGTHEYTPVYDKEKEKSDEQKYKQEYECYLRFKEVFPDALHGSCFEKGLLNVPGYETKYGVMYNTDIYIPSINMIIECQYYPSHGPYPYNPNDPKLKDIEQEILTSYKMRHVEECDRLKVYEVTDPAKRECAKRAGFNYGEIWDHGRSWEFIMKIKEIVDSGDLKKLRHITIYRNERTFNIETDFNE